MSGISPLQAIYLLSSVGALVFFVAGWVSAGLRRSPALAQPLPAGVGLGESDLSATLAQERQQRSRAVAEGAELRLRVTAMERESHQLRAELQTRARAAEQLSAERQRMAGELEQQRGAPDGSRAEIVRLGQALEGERRARAQREQEVGRELGELDGLRKALVTERAARTQHEQALETERAARAKHEQETGRQAGELARLRSRNAELEHEIQRLGPAALTAEKPAGAAPDAKLRTEIDTARRQLSAAQQQLAKTGEVEQRYQSLLAQKEALELRLTTSQTQFQRVKNEADQTRKEAASLRAELERVSARAKAVDATASQAAELERLRTKLVAAEAQGAELGRLQQEARASAALQEEARQLRVELGVAHAKVAELERVRSENVELREEKAAQAGAASDLVGAQSELREARIKLEAMQSRLADVEAVRERSRELGDEVARLAAELQHKASLEVEQQELRRRLSSAESKAAQLADALEDNHKLRDELAELERARGAMDQLERLAGEHKQLKLDHELLTRRVLELTGASEEHLALRERVEELSRSADEAQPLRARVRQLEAKLFAAGIVEPAAVRAETRAVASAPSGALESELDKLLRATRVRTAVLADAGGLVVAGSGEAAMHEALAAWSGMANTLADRACDLLPLTNVIHVEMQDGNRTTITCRFFQCLEELYAVTMVGSERLAPEAIEGALAQVSAAMSAQRTSP
jgi:chromosome segregation ATPase